MTPLPENSIQLAWFPAFPSILDDWRLRLHQGFLAAFLVCCVNKPWIQMISTFTWGLSSLEFGIASGKSCTNIILHKSSATYFRNCRISLHTTIMLRFYEYLTGSCNDSI